MTPRSLCLALVFLILGLHLVHSVKNKPPSDHYSRALQNTTTEWPSLRFHFKLKRKSMNVFGHSEFFMYANPVPTNAVDQVKYNVFGELGDETAAYNYTFIDGIAYYSRFIKKERLLSVKCSDSESDTIPPINAIVAAINVATPVSSISGSDSGLKCSNGSWFHVSVNSITFGLCASGSTGFAMYSSDMDIEVDYLNSHVEITTPVLDSNDNCKSCASPTLVSEIGEAILTGKPVPTSSTRRLNGDQSISLDGCSCKSTPRPCIFIHGMGISTEEPENQDSLPLYWANMTEHAPCCSSIKYSVLDTVNTTWTSGKLQNKVCNRALAVSPTSTATTIRDTIIVTHSMGNLMLSGAIATGKCRLDSSTTWVGLAGPMRGSMASDYVQDACAADANFVMKSMVKNSGRCPPTTALKALAYEGESYSFKALNAAYNAAQQTYRSNVSALMCSNGFSGLLSTDQWGFWVLGLVVPHKSNDNDGMVEFQSCTAGIPESKFGDHWSDRFYKTKLNHYDMQFIHGDALLNPAKMPVKWFECLL